MREWRGVVTADLHIHPFRLCSQDSGLDRLHDGLVATNQTLSRARAEKATWYCLGDIKHTRTVWNQVALAGLLRLLREFSDVRKIMICGNHDGVGLKDSAESGLAPFADVAECYTQPCCVDGDAFWPWQPTMDCLPDFLSDARAQGARRLFGHCFIEGSRLGPADVRLQGAGISLKTFGLIGKKSQRDFDIAFFGDVHKQQTLGDPKGVLKAAIYVPGSPYAHNWGDIEPDKGALYGRGEVGKYEILPFPIKGTPRFLVKSVTNCKELAAFAYAVNEEDSARGNFIRLVLHPTLAKDYADDVRLVVASLRGDSGARHVETVLASQVESASKPNQTIHAGMPNSDLLNAYVEARTPSWLKSEKVSPDVLVRAGLRLMEPL